MFDSITSAIRLPDNIPHLESGTLLISDGVMRMLPGKNASSNIVEKYGNDPVWSFYLKSQRWHTHDSGIKDHALGTAVAFDAEKQIGWYYGGFYRANQLYFGEYVGTSSKKSLHDLYRLDKGSLTPIKVDTDSSLVGDVVNGELVYIGDVGEAGILVLIGGAQSDDLVSMIDQLKKFCHSQLPY